MLHYLNIAAMETIVMIVNPIKMQMDMIMNIKFFVLITLVLIFNNGFSQIYPASGGSFVVFHTHVQKDSDVTLQCADEKSGRYKWPSGSNDFIRAFRDAEKIFKAPLLLTDEDLTKIFTNLEEKKELNHHICFSPVLLIALGQAVFLPGNNNITSCKITSHEDQKSRLLELIDQRNLTADSTVVKKSDSKRIVNNLQIIFPMTSWIDSARVYKKVLGSSDSVQIYPEVYTTQLIDRVEMHIRDTSRIVGEFIYTIQPYDRLGLWHAPLKGIYAENYTTLSSPSIIRFYSNVLEGSKSIKLSWKSAVPERIRGYEVFRSQEYKGPYARIATLPSEDTMYVDHVEGVMRNFFYYVQIIDQHGPGFRSIIQFVTPSMMEKPMPPVEPLAEMVPGGIKISWPTWDGMHHVRGYYVYRKDADTTSWTQVSPYLPAVGTAMSFIDSSEQLKPELQYEYAVKSESTSYILSDLSEHAWGRPGKSRIVASPESFGWRYLDDGQLLFYWNDARNADPFIKSYHIFETDHQGTIKKQLTTEPLSSSVTTWINHEKNPGEKYYCIQVEDTWGNKSGCNSPVKPAVKDYIIHPDLLLAHPVTNGYRLSWGTPTSANVKEILLYEINTSGNPFLVKSFKTDANSYVIPALKEDQAKTFYITYKMLDGKESDASDAVTLVK